MHFADFLKQKTFKLDLDGKEYKSPNLRQFFVLEKLRYDFFRDKKNIKNILSEVIETYTDNELTGKEPALKVLTSILQIFSNSILENTPAFLVPPPDTKKETKTDRWAYPGHYMAEWINLIAENYNWGLDEILNTDAQTAVYLIQEILVSKQKKHEWEYQITELAYQYDQNSKKSKFVPLPRPYWMDETVDKKIEKTKLLKSSLPFGVVTFGKEEVVSADANTG